MLKKLFKISFDFKLIIILIFISLGNSLLFADEGDYKFDRISTEDGLSQSTVFCITQDSKGFIWIGTQGGLNKYDGYSFTVYKYNPFDSTSLSDNWVQAIVEDTSGNLWIGTHSSGIFFFDRDKNIFTCFRNNPYDKNSLINNRVWSLYQDKDGYLWVGTSGGLDKFDVKNNKFTHFVHDPKNPNSLSQNAVNAIYEDKDSIMWLGTWGGGLVRFDRYKNTFKNYMFKSGNIYHHDSRIKAIIEDRIDGQLWLGSIREGLIRFNKTDGSYIQYLHDPNDNSTICQSSIISLAQDKNGKIWAGTYDGGVSRFNRKTQTFTNFHHNPKKELTINDNWVQALYEDRSGVLWLGTSDGINKYIASKQNFKNIQNNPNDPNSIVSNDINSVYEANNGIIWIGTWNSGLVKYDRKKNTFKTYQNIPYNYHSLSSNIVLNTMEDNKGNLWVATAAGLDKFDRSNETFQNYYYSANDPQSLSFNNISAIFQDSFGIFWIGTWGGGLNRKELNSDKFSHYHYIASDSTSISDELITCFYEDREKNLYIGTNAGGLNLYLRNMDKFKRYEYNPEDKYSLSSNTINCIYEDKDGIMWIGTLGGGLNQFDRKKNKFYHYSELQGLPNNSIFGIIEDDNRNLWLSTAKGLSKFNLDTKKFINFDVKDGIGSREFSLAAAKLRNGNIILGGNTGITIFNPDSIYVNNFDSPLIIKSFKLFDKELKFDKEITDVKSIELNYNQNVFSIEYAALDYIRPDKIQYQYMLEGFDENWINAGQRRVAYYTNIDAGKYKFRLRASNGVNGWIEKSTSLNIRVIPPFWLTWWFITLTILILIAIMLMIFRYRLNRLLEMERLRTRIAADLHDEIASNLSSIAMFSKIIQDESNSFTKISAAMPQLLDRIISLSQESVVAIRDIIWAIDPKTETIYNLLLRIRDNCISTCRAKSISFKFILPEKELLPSENLSPEQRKNLWLLLKEGINNAVKHAQAKEISLAVTYNGGHLKVIIKDNGVGYDTTTHYEGKGLTTMKKRVDDLHGKLNVISKLNEGTIITIILNL